MGVSVMVAAFAVSFRSVYLGGDPQTPGVGAPPPRPVLAWVVRACFGLLGFAS